MRRPSFQFYPGDWTANPNLRRCTFAEKGIWLDVLCLMHDQDEYGVLRWPLKEIAQAVGCKLPDLQSLARKGVLKGADDMLAEPYVFVPRHARKDGEPVTLIPTQPGPIWYSSRMVRDEHVRAVRGESIGNGEAPKAAPKPPTKPAPKAPIGEAFGPRESSSSSSSSPSGVVSVPSEPHPPAGAGGQPAARKPDRTPTIPCPYERIVALYHEALPTLPRVVVMNAARQKGMRKLWAWVLTSRRSDGERRAVDAEGALEWLAAYFARASANDFLMGRTQRTAGHENWTADFDFLLSEKGKLHVIEKTREAA